MRAIGLTGGMGCGKSTVAGLLAERGATVLDADRITRELQRPGKPVYEAIVERYQDDLVHYFNLVLTAEVLDTLLVMQQHQGPTTPWEISADDERAVLEFLQRALGAESTALRGASRLRQALDLVEAGLRDPRTFTPLAEEALEFEP
ncbi:MAG: dephospho-CoA kinase [Actinobacteria bacterium]|nr:dephospho-CoA kinase [Actinomycetota bacterium]